jgi:hypothetical protein
MDLRRYDWQAANRVSCGSRINILKEGTTKADFQFNALVGFCPDFRFGGGVLLGQNGFMSRFKTTLSSRKTSLKSSLFNLICRRIPDM